MEIKFDETSFKQLFANLNRISLLIAELIAKNKNFRNINLQADLEKIQDFPGLNEIMEYVDEDILFKVINNNNYQVEKEYFLNLIPFFNKETVLKIVLRYLVIDAELLLAILPFIEEHQLQEIIVTGVQNKKITITSDLIERLAPFVRDQQFLFNLK